MEINKVGVLGCGLMGSGIAQVCASAGYKTIVREVEQGFLDSLEDFPDIQYIFGLQETIAVSMAVYGATVATTSIAGTAAVERSKGWGRLLGLTPMRQAEYAAAKVLVALAIAALPVIVVFIVAALTGADIGPIGTWISTGLITVAASAMFALYGLTFGLLFRSESAVGAASGLLVVLAFFGNLFMPLSGTLLTIAKFTPLYGLIQLVRYPLTEGRIMTPDGLIEEPLWVPLANVAAWLLILAMLATWLVRRSRGRQ